MGWRTVLTSRGGVAHSELPGIKGRTIGLPAVGSGATASITVPLDRPEADLLIECDTLLRVHDEAGVLRAHLEQITAEEVVDENGGSVAATFADPLWTLARRLCGKSPTGLTVGTAVAPVDRGQIIRQLVDGTNDESISGLTVGTVLPCAKTWVTGWYYKPVAEGLSELAATLDGPDFLIRPIPWTPAARGSEDLAAGMPDGAEGSIAAIDIAPSIGQLRPDAVWEFGDGRLNVRGYRRTVTKDGTANKAYHLPTGFPDSATAAVLTRTDPASIAQRRLLETVVTADLSVETLRQQLLDRHIAVRSGPRQTFTFEVASNRRRVPAYGTDWDVGDVVPFNGSVRRAGRLRKRFSGLWRIYAASVTIDELDVAQMALTVTPGGA